MTNEMRDRLKENISIIKRHNDTGIPVVSLTNRNKFEVQVIDEIIEDCSSIIEKMENQTLIYLPCKVGDTVYSFCDTFGPILILPYFIETFHIGFLDKDRDYWTWEANSHSTETDELLDEIDFDLDDIGKTVFLTKDQAEQKLKEMRGGKMREILFRGQGIDRNWYYGVPLVLTEDYVCMTAPHTYNKKVEINTVGQYTGLTDKNGKKIFDKDIVTLFLADGVEVGVIGWSDIDVRYKFASPDGTAYDVACTCVFEIIGNIHDNPELVKGDVQNDR